MGGAHGLCLRADEGEHNGGMPVAKNQFAFDEKTIEIDASELYGFREVRLDSPLGKPSEDATMTSSLEASVASEYQGYQALVTRTIDVFGDELTASRWLSMPSIDFQNKTPIEAAEEVSYNPLAIERLFEPVFIRIEHGIDW